MKTKTLTHLYMQTAYYQLRLHSRASYVHKMRVRNNPKYWNRQLWPNIVDPSDVTKQGILSGSTLFAIYPIDLKTPTVRTMDLFTY